MRLLPLASASWEFRDATNKSPWRAARVPGCVHTDLRRHNLIPDPFFGTNELGLQWIEEHALEYRATFAVSAALLREEVVELVADGLDTVATVRLNGRVVARTENMFAAHRWDVRPLLRAGSNELTVHFGSATQYIRTHRTGHDPREFNDPIGRSQVIRKQQCQFGWDWGPRFVTAGIWRDIRLEAWSQNRLVGVRVTQTHRKRRQRPPRLRPELARHGRTVTLTGTVSLERHATVAEIEDLKSKINNPELWWPNGHGDATALPRSTSRQALPTDGTHRSAPGRVRIGLRTLELDRHKDQGRRIVPIRRQRPRRSSPRAPTGSRRTASSPGCTRADYRARPARAPRRRT